MRLKWASARQMVQVKITKTKVVCFRWNALDFQSDINLKIHLCVIKPKIAQISYNGK